jgi:hypothetical protein
MFQCEMGAKNFFSFVEEIVHCPGLKYDKDKQDSRKEGNSEKNRGNQDKGETTLMDASLTGC